MYRAVAPRRTLPAHSLPGDSGSDPADRHGTFPMITRVGGVSAADGAGALPDRDRGVAVVAVRRVTYGQVRQLEPHF